MLLRVNADKLNEIMKAFYVLTGIKIIVFDKEHNVVVAYPKDDCGFCRIMKSSPITAEKCFESDTDYFFECMKKDKLMIYTCHAGLIEACAPLKQNRSVIGYIMFGQISDLTSRDDFLKKALSICENYGIPQNILKNEASKIKLKTHNQILASAQILEACISYILLNDILFQKRNNIIEESECYIDRHLADVTVSGLCSHLKISRTKLYYIYKEEIGVGISGYIRSKQLKKAKELVLETKLSITEIAARCGFSDYNYFNRVFKSKYKKSPKVMRGD